VKQQDDWVFENTGFHTEIFRFPGGSAWATHESLSTAACIEVLKDLGLEWIDWSCNIYDAGTEPSGYEGGARVAVSQIKTMDIAVMLSHDWNLGTVYALKIAVPKLQEMGYEFLPLFPQSLTMGENTQIIFK
jgi:peptidoglycan/xylan/chitin deacetylase (PgdA/CDA1 family)